MKKTFTTSLILVALTTLTGYFLSSTYTIAEDVVDEISITVPTSCTLSESGTDSHNAEIANGTYQANIGTTTIDVYCNDNQGFSIYATGFTGDTIGRETSNKLVGASVPTSAAIATGTATTTGDPDVSNWAMKLATNSQATYALTLTTGYDAFHAVPNEYTKVATRLSGTDVGDNATGSTLTTTYAAYISKTQPADTYSGKVKYVLVHPNDETVPVPAAVTFDTAYAAANKEKTNGYYEMQDMSSDICEAVTLVDSTSETTLIDSRDNKTYTVAKLQDGNCWMTQNLDHDIVTTQNYYTNENTDIGWNSSTHSYDNTTWTADYATSNVSYNDGQQSPYNSIVSYNPGNYYWIGELGNYSLLSSGDSHYHIGNYYNGAAALALNSVYYQDWDPVNEEWEYNEFSEAGYDVDQSICPVGWTLPKGGEDFTGSGSFRYLIEQYGYNENTSALDGYTFHEEPLYFALVSDGERAMDGANSYIGDYGNYWTSVTAYMGDGYSNLYALQLTNENDSWGHITEYATGNGLSIRCVARNF